MDTSDNIPQVTAKMSQEAEILVKESLQDKEGSTTGTSFIIPSIKLNEAPKPSKSYIGYMNKPSPNNLQINSLPVGSATGNPRNKTALRPGYSLMDWIRLTKSPGKNLSGRGGSAYINVTTTELERHSKRNDAWIAINGLVFNVTPYMDYHPGGWEELVRGAGIDATDLFNEVHRWVNYESMLTSCLIGKLVAEPLKLIRPISTKVKVTPPADIVEPVKTTLTIPPMASVKPNTTQKSELTHDWYQTKTTIVITIYTKRKSPEYSITSENALVEVTNDNSVDLLEKRDRHQLKIRLRLPEKGIVVPFSSHRIFYVLENKIRIDQIPEVSLTPSTGKLEIKICKADPPLNASYVPWKKLGVQIKSDDYPENSVEFRPWSLVEKIPITHDVMQYTLQPMVPGLHQLVPCGHHVQFKVNVLEDISLERSYTPVFDTILPKSNERTNTPDRNIHFLIKTYEVGAVTQYLNQVGKGCTILLSDTLGGFDRNRLKSVRHLVLAFAGTGFTPMVKVLREFCNLVEDAESKNTLTILCFNKTVKDIIWKEQLDGLDKSFTQPQQLSVAVHYTLSQEKVTDYEQTYHHGRISLELLTDVLPQTLQNRNNLEEFVDEKRLCCICGPIPFNREAKLLFCNKFNYLADELCLFEG